MFVEESVWIREQLAALALPEGTRLLNIGSSNKDVRCRIQSHVDANVFAPLIQRGWSITHLDQKDEEGVDLVVNIEDPHLKERISKVFDVVICTNLLEHVRDAATAMRNIVGFVVEGGYLLLTAPRRYPRHKDPIDTLYRPSDKKLQELMLRFARFQVQRSQVIDIRDPAYYFYESRIPLYGYRRGWRYFFKGLRWKVSCVVAKKCESGEKNGRP
jgi:SAM-dependent methyltransferase